MNEILDVIIIGKGPAGLSASLYTSRAGLKTLVIGGDSQLKKAHKINNYFGFPRGISGQDLLEQGESQAEELGVKFDKDEVLSLESNKEFKVKTINSEYQSKAVLIATGMPAKPVEGIGVRAFEGKGVHYCVSCDGYFYRNLKTGVIGSRDYAVHEALELLNYTTDVTIFTNGNPLEVSDKYCDHLNKFKINNKKLAGFEGKEFLETIVFKDGSSEKVDGIFIAEGRASSIDFAKKLGVLVKENQISVNEHQQTNIPGLFAAGDCTGGLRQISTAVGQGAVAGKKIIEFLNNT